MQSTRRWLNQSQPQTLVIATWLLYFSAAFTFIFFSERLLFRFGLCGTNTSCWQAADMLRLLLPAGGLAAGYGIANERRWGYALGLATAILPVAARVMFAFRARSDPLSDDFIGLAFDVALVILLLHTMSREYVRVWFK